jgi:undecaprenyl diphosphate synthase
MIDLLRSPLEPLPTPARPPRLWLRSSRPRTAAAQRRGRESEPPPELVRPCLPSHVALVTDYDLDREERALGRCLRALSHAVFAAHHAGIDYLTVSTFARLGIGTTARPEQAALASTLLEFVCATQSRLVAAGVRVLTIGRADELPTRLRRALEGLCDATSAGTGLTLTLAVGYTGRSDIVDAARALATLIRAGRLLPEEVDEHALRRQLVSHMLPAVELAIYTGAVEGRDFLPFEIDSSTKVRLGLPLSNFRPKHLAVALELYARAALRKAVHSRGR